MSCLAGRKHHSWHRYPEGTKLHTGSFKKGSDQCSRCRKFRFEVKAQKEAAVKRRKEKEKKPYLAVLSYSPSHGLSSYLTICSKCGMLLRVYVWSLHGCGKKCPKCKQVYGKHDVRKPDVVKLHGKWVFKVGERLYSKEGVRIQ